MPFNMFPFSNLHNLNADWLLKTVKEAAEDASESAESAAASAAIAEGVQGQITELDGRVEACETGLSHAVKFTPQTLTLLQQGQARNNIGAISAGELSDSGAVIYNHEQTLTTEQKAVARANIGAVANNASALSQAGAVTYGSEQYLTDTQKARARANIGAVSSSDIPSITGAVLFDESQDLTNSEKAQARTNIDAAPAGGYVKYDSAQNLSNAQKALARSNIGVSGADDQPLIVTVWPNELGTAYECDTKVSDIIDAVNWGRLIIIQLQTSEDSTIYNAVAFIDAESTPNTVTTDIFMPADPGSSSPSRWYRVYLAAGSPNDTVLVTELQGRFVPLTTIADRNKTLVVNSSGKPAWVQVEPVTVTDLSSTSIILAPATNTIYEYGELTSLTISNPPATGAYSIVFTSGSTATTTTIPSTILGLESFAAEANTLYEINVLDNRAVIGSWAVSA